jgi:hypothetical protein
MLTVSFWYGREGCHNSNIAWRHVGLFPTDRPSVPTVQEKKFFFKDFRLLWGIVSYFLSFSVEWKRKRNHFFTLRSFYSIMVFPSGDQIQLINNGSKKKNQVKWLDVSSAVGSTSMQYIAIEERWHLSDPSLVGERLVLFQSNSCETSDGARLIRFRCSIVKRVCSLFFKTYRRYIPKHTWIIDY